MKQIYEKIFASILLCVILISTCSSTILAITELTDAYIQKIGNADYHLKYYKESTGQYTYSICSIVGHYYNGTFYPAYCMNRNLDGVGEAGSYNVDVGSILANDQIWRAVKNGYPYKTAKELGLTSDYDAFVVTKFAVYCLLGQADINLYAADEEDAEGQAMLTALRKLVDIGKNGTETQSNSLKITKDGELTEDGDYYSIKYKVTSTVEMKSYEVTQISNFPDGTLVTNITGNIKTSFASGEEFKIKIPKSKLTQDISASIQVEAESKTYPIFYGKTRIAGTQDYILTGDSYGTQKATTDVNLKLNTGKIIVNKVDSETKTPIAGVTFELLDKNNNKLATTTTNTSGQAEFTGLYQGTYIIKETKTNEQYVVNDQDFTVNVEYNKTSEINIENNHTSGNLKVYKVDKDNHNLPISNVQFDLYSQEFKKVIGTYYTDSKGQINIENLRTGKYNIIEKATNEWYNFSNVNEEIEIKKGETTTITIENEAKKGQVKIEKVDAEYNEIKISGVVFEVLDENMNVLEEITTDENGIAYTSKYAVKDHSKLYIKEKQANQNYILDETIHKVKLVANETSTLSLTNKKKTGNIKLVKVDKDNHEIALGNVEFDLYSEEFQKVIGTYTTNVDGEIKIDNLRVGEYKLIEKNTGKWYNLAEDAIVEVAWNETEETIVENELKKGRIKIIKVDLENEEIKLEGVKFNVLDENGKLLETITTDENGEAYTSRYAVRDYPQLTIIETETLENYALNKTPQTIALEADQIKQVTFTNEVKKGQIKVVKVDSDNNEVRLPGVEFNVIDEDGNIVDNLVTDEFGEAVSKRLRIDKKYIIQETKTLQNYELTEETQEVTLTQDGITSVTFENEKKKSTIKVIKVDKDNNEVYLEGVTFNILNSQGEIVDTITTNENGEAESKKLPIDEEYKVVEIKTQENYLLTQEPQIVKLDQDQITTLTFENEKKKGQIKIIKTSKDDNKVTNETAGAPLEGVEFEIYNENNRLVENIKTDVLGIAISSKLELGKYKIKEKSTNEWYILDENSYEVTIEENDQVAILELKNSSVNPDVKIEKVGPNEAAPDEEIKYEFTIKNTSNTKLENFYWIDQIPTDYIKVTKIETGTYNQKQKYDLYYKTNMTSEYILLMEDLSSLENNQIDFIQELADNEYVTEIKYDFKTVDIGFESANSPLIYANVDSNVKSEDSFVNTSLVEGIYNGYKVSDESNWKTVVYKILPLTGM